MPQYTISNERGEVLGTKNFEYLPKVTDELDSLKNGKLSQDEIFKITLWKLNRYPEKASETAKLVESLKKNKKKLKEVLSELLKTNGVGLPMASTYLRFCDPSNYQIIDVRAFRAAFDFCPENYDAKRKSFPLLGVAGYEVYNKYLKKLHEIEKNGFHGLYVRFEDLDRFLYDVDKAFGHKLEDNMPSNEWKKLMKLKTIEQSETILGNLKKYIK